MLHLKEIREKKGISQAEVARQIEVSRQTYNNYELGKREADYETLLKLSEVLETSVEEILTGVSESIKKIPPESRWERIRKNLEKLSDDSVDKVDDYISLLAERDDSSKSWFSSFLRFSIILSILISLSSLDIQSTFQFVFYILSYKNGQNQDNFGVK